MSRSTFLLIGPGAIGGIVTRSLNKIGGDIIVKVKNDDQKERLRNDGLLVEMSPGTVEKIRNFKVITSWEELESVPKWIFVTLKIPDLLKESELLKKHVNHDSYVVYFQNGVLEDYLPPELLSRGAGRVICWWSAKMVDFGHITFVRAGETHVGTINASLRDEDRTELLESLQFVPSTTRWFEDIRGSELAKTVFNAALNGLTYLTGLHLGDILAKKEGRTAFEGIITEGVMVSDKLGLTLPTIRRMSLRDFSAVDKGVISSLKKLLYWRALKRIGKNLISSARLSYLRGRTSELPWLNGYLVRKGKELGLEVPWNEQLMEYHDLIEKRELEPTPELLKELCHHVLAP